MNNKVKIVFICMGNICRSPTAEGVFHNVVMQRGLTDSIEIDSAGTHAYHVGEQPDSRAQSTALKRGVNLSAQKARKVTEQDFERFDYVIAMDRSNYENLKDVANGSNLSKLFLFMDFTKDWDNPEVPDPYYGGANGFEEVFDMVQSASEGLLEHILKNNL